MRSRIGIVVVALVVGGCGVAPSVDGGVLDGSARLDAGARDASVDAAVVIDADRLDAGSSDAGSSDAGSSDAASGDAGSAPEPCATRITYGSSWIHGAEHPEPFDEVTGLVTWDGVCHHDGVSSYAELSNGWRPYFRGESACILALDARGACAPPPLDECRTRITYGPSWRRAPGHDADFDEVRGVVTWDGECAAASGGDSSALLSNGWTPHFVGAGACALSFRYAQCDGLYTNPVVPTGCADPGVVRDGARYVMVCTSGNAAAAFPIRTSRDLVTWRTRGHVFPAGTRPGWASGDFWAPEIHRVGTRWVAYYSARRAVDGRLAVGAATASDVLGPYTDLGAPLVHDPSPGVIDAHHYEAPDGQHYLTWKVDGNAVGAPTPIRIQRLEDDGVTRVGPVTTILTNDLAWEGALVEGQWMIHHDGFTYLFYSANSFASTRYAVGVARATSPLGPFEKLGPPILTSNSAFSGPGHGSIVRGPRGDWVHVYHSWIAGQVDAAPGRVVLLDRITWSGGWPRMRSQPSPRSQPPP